MTCYDCAYLGFDRNEVVGMAEMCNHPGNGFLVLDLLTVNMNVNFQKQIWDIKWDSYSEKEKEQALRYFRENYHKNPIEGLTCEGAEMSFIEYLKMLMQTHKEEKECMKHDCQYQ